MRKNLKTSKITVTSRQIDALNQNHAELSECRRQEKADLLYLFETELSKLKDQVNENTLTLKNLQDKVYSK